MTLRLLILCLFLGANMMQAQAEEVNPYAWIEKWITEENSGPLLGILATVDDQCRPHTRTITIREITPKGVLFFTQKGSKKVAQIKSNPATSLTLYLPFSKRQITFRGSAEPLSDEENTGYWETYPRESQLRFLVYGPKSGQKIASNASLDQELDELRKDSQNQSLDRPESYVGYRIQPVAFEFYQLNQDRLSDSFVIHHENDNWIYARVAP